MIQYILRRLLQAIPTLFVIVTLAFFLVRLAPGGPFAQEVALPEQARERLEAYYGLDDPLPVQYARWLGNLVFRGDLGPSMSHPAWSVNELIAERLPVSIELGLWGLAVALLFGISLGVTASLRPNTLLDHAPMALAMAGICLPMFVLGPLLLLAFALNLEWVNVAGWNTPRDRILPALTLGLFYAAFIARLTRGSMLEVRQREYMRTARAKGLSGPRIHLLHALRNALNPVVSFLGPALAGLISGSFVVETIFGIAGLGTFFVQAALDADHTLVMGTVIVYAVLIIAFNLISDIVQVLLNPRIRFE